jgi:hypothetical protein
MEVVFAYETSNLTKTNFMEPDPSSDATTRSAIQEFPNVLRNPKIHYRVHNSLHFSLSCEPDESRSYNFILFL